MNEGLEPPLDSIKMSCLAIRRIHNLILRSKRYLEPKLICGTKPKGKRSLAPSYRETNVVLKGNFLQTDINAVFANSGDSDRNSNKIEPF